MRSAQCIGSRGHRLLLRWCGAALGAAAWLVLPGPLHAQIANSEAIVDMVSEPGGAGFGFLFSSERSPYRGEGHRRDLLPVYLYEGDRFFLRTDRLGLKFAPADNQALDVYLRRRLEGFPLDNPPPILQGLPSRNGGLDLGLTWRLRTGLGQLHAGVTQNVGRDPRGQELHLGAHTDWRFGRLTLRPAATVTWRSRRSNTFYFGVPDDEASALRPAYRPGAGVDLWAGLYASYQLSDGWRLFGGVAATRYAGTVRASPIVDHGTQPGVVVGATYNLGAQKLRTQVADSPTLVRVLYGVAAVDRCNMVLIVTLRCTTINSDTPTEIAGLALGKMLVQGLNGWPLDVAAYVGLIYHQDRPFQRNGGEVNLFIKGYYRGFPWSERVLTRAGFGWGITIADPVPYAEVAEQASRGRLTSRVLNYNEPSIDISLGDAIGKPAWKHTFVGLSVTHRSGIYGNSRLLGKANGGSNYITLYLEHSI